MQKFWKSVKTWQSYREFKSGNFWDTLYSNVNNNNDDDNNCDDNNYDDDYKGK